MPAINKKLDRFTATILAEATAETERAITALKEKKAAELSAAEDKILLETYNYIHAEVSRIKAEAGRKVSTRMLDNKRAVYLRRDQIAHEVFDAVRAKIAAYTATPGYADRLRALLQEALHTLTGEEHGFGYRRSVFRDHPDWTVVRTWMRLQPGDPAEILNRMNDLAQRRRDKQPLNFPSAGSTFKRPEGHFAGQLIEQAGLKGTFVGGAQVSEKHAGFLINRGGATCEDMLRLIELVQQRVREQFGVELECEVRIIR